MALEDIHIEVFVIAPYKVYDSNGILKHEKNNIQPYGIAGFGGMITWQELFLPNFTFLQKVFVELSDNLREKIITEYGISLPEGNLWCTRLKYQGKTKNLDKDVIFEKYVDEEKPVILSTRSTCRYPGCSTSAICLTSGVCATFGVCPISGVCGYTPNTYGIACSLNFGFTGAGYDSYIYTEPPSTLAF